MVRMQRERSEKELRAASGKGLKPVFDLGVRCAPISVLLHEEGAPPVGCADARAATAQALCEARLHGLFVGVTLQEEGFDVQEEGYDVVIPPPSHRYPAAIPVRICRCPLAHACRTLAPWPYSGDRAVVHPAGALVARREAGRADHAAARGQGTPQARARQGQGAARDAPQLDGAAVVAHLCRGRAAAACH
eukprot:3765966-Prymnesium_polylepis.1